MKRVLALGLLFLSSFVSAKNPSLILEDRNGLAINNSVNYLIAGSAEEASSTLNDNLDAYWALTETSGNRADSIGSVELADNNTVGSTSGPKGNIAVFVDSAFEYLDAADSAAVSADGLSDWSVSCIIYSDATSNNDAFISTWDGTNNGGYKIYNISTNLYFAYKDTGNNTNVATLGAYTAGTYYLATVVHDGAANTVTGYVNETAGTPVAETQGIKDSTTDFRIGADELGTPQYLDGRVGHCAIWSKALSSDEVSERYNGGDFAIYPF